MGKRESLTRPKGILSSFLSFHGWRSINRRPSLCNDFSLPIYGVCTFIQTGGIHIPLFEYKRELSIYL